MVHAARKSAADLFGSTAASRRSLAPSEEVGGSPHALMPVIRRHPETGEPVDGELLWGLIPHYMKSRPAVQPINARAESVADVEMFRDAYRLRRCIVPMTAFYQKDSRGRRHAFSVKHVTTFGVAGIWENWSDPQTGKWLRTFATITVEANALIKPFNERMPAILRPQDHRRWIGTEPDPRDLLKPFPAESMSERKVRG